MKVITLKVVLEGCFIICSLPKWPSNGCLLKMQVKVFFYIETVLFNKKNHVVKKYPSSQYLYLSTLRFGPYILFFFKSTRRVRFVVIRQILNFEMRSERLYVL